MTMNALDITRCIGVPHLTLENFELTDPDTRYILTSPRSLEACERCGIRPVGLLRTSVEEFYDEYKDRDYLSRSEILEEFHLQEKVRLAKLSQAREERQRIIYIEAENEASKIPLYLEEKKVMSSRSSPNIKRTMSPNTKPKSPVSWDSSVKGSELPLRSSINSDIVSLNPTETQKSWVNSFRSPSPATSTPVKRTVSNENISVIGQKSCLKDKSKPLPRSSSLPRRTPSFRDKLKSKSDTQLSHKYRATSTEDLQQSYGQLMDTHRELSSNVAQLEGELKTLKLQQRREEVITTKKANIEGLRLRKQSDHAAARTRHSRNKVSHVVRSSAPDNAVRNLLAMESQNRTHLLRETQAHINELKSEIKQYKAQRSARILEEERQSWVDLVDKRQSRALERADIKARRYVRDKSAKARRMRLDKERHHAQNMKNLIIKEEMNLLKNLDSIISKENKAEYLQFERERMVKKCQEVSRRSANARLRNSKSFDKMSQEAALLAHLENKGIARRWR